MQSQVQRQKEEGNLSMAYRLASKIALITGAAQEIGRSCAELFAKEGTFVFVYDERFRDHQNIVLDIYIGI